uniref:hypothetical protein n=1 Tax=Salmonella sp. s29873 TaxID=3159634 RepID=UPI00397FEC47
QGCAASRNSHTTYVVCDRKTYACHLITCLAQLNMITAAEGKLQSYMGVALLVARTYLVVGQLEMD